MQKIRHSNLKHTFFLLGPKGLGFLHYINVFYSDSDYFESIYVTFKLQESDSVTNRVAGFICKYVFSAHESCVTSLVIIMNQYLSPLSCRRVIL